MKLVQRITVVAAVALVAAAAQAYPTVMPGPSGAIMLPTADVQSTTNTPTGGQVTVATAFWDTVNTETIPIRATLGLGTAWEVGGVFAFNDTADIWGVNAKFSEPMTNRSRTALGAVYLKADDVNTTVDQVYVAHTRPFFSLTNRNQLKGTVGVNWTRIDQTITDNDAVRIYGAVEYVNAGNASVYAELQSRAPKLGDTRNLVSAGVRFPVNRPVLFEIGVSNATPLGVQGQTPTRWFAGVGIKTE